jgi:hypothetical protein
MRRFLLDAGEAFVIAFAVVAVDDASKLVDAVGTKEQLVVGLAAITRAATAAGLRAVLPMLVALRESLPAAPVDRENDLFAVPDRDPADPRPHAAGPA